MTRASLRASTRQASRPCVPFTGQSLLPRLVPAARTGNGPVTFGVGRDAGRRPAVWSCQRAEGRDSSGLGNAGVLVGRGQDSGAPPVLASPDMRAARLRGAARDRGRGRDLGAKSWCQTSGLIELLCSQADVIDCV